MHPGEAAPTGPADFDETFRGNYWPMVRSLAVACGDEELAAEVVQEAFTRAYVRWRRIRSYDNPPAWIRHVAVNQLRDDARRRARRERALTRLRHATPTSVAPPEPPSEIMRLLAPLPRQQRIAASLFYVEDLSVEEVARSMGLSEGAVKFHLHAARRTLGERMRAHGHDVDAKTGEA